jgi:uncharacterized protein (DUF1330 family)
MAAYVIYEGEVVDADLYEEYKAGAAASIATAGGRYLVRGGELDVLDGERPSGRVVVLEFPTRQAALDWWHGEAYTRVRPIRERAARTHRLVLIDGWDG